MFTEVTWKKLKVLEVGLACWSPATLDGGYGNTTGPQQRYRSQADCQPDSALNRPFGLEADGVEEDPAPEGAGGLLGRERKRQAWAFQPFKRPGRFNEAARPFEKSQSPVETGERKRTSFLISASVFSCEHDNCDHEQYFYDMSRVGVNEENLQRHKVTGRKVKDVAGSQ